MKPFHVASLLLLAASAARAELKMPSVFADHMILQEGVKLPIWGRADPGEEISVTLGERKAQAVTAADGRWKAELDPSPGSSIPAKLEVRGAQRTLAFSDVLLGDVWFCSGQSNMAYTVGNMPDAAKWAAEATSPTIRYYHTEKQIAGAPQDDAPGKWVLVTPETVKRCSAVSYFMARDLQAAGHGPIGLLVVSTGGVPIQSFMSLDALETDSAFEPYAAEFHAAKLPADPVVDADPNQETGNYREDKKPLKTPAVLFNGTIHPLAPYALKGMVFYHGASNTWSKDEAVLYQRLLVALIRDWRKAWVQPDLPFVIEQINPYGEQINRAILRNSQLLAAAEPHTGLCVSIDIGEKEHQHFGDKSDIGARMALAARELAYGENVVGFGPIFQSMETEGAKLRIHFRHLGSGLAIGVPPPAATGGAKLPLPEHLSDFELSGPDGKYLPAQAKIEGDTVLVWSDTVTAPKNVRYAWAAYPDPLANLYNQEGLPASPFNSELR